MLFSRYNRVCFINNLDRSFQSDDCAGIPCEWCGKGIPLDVYERHAVSSQVINYISILIQ